MKIKCLIVDDEPLAINVLKKHLSNFNELELWGTCQNAEEAAQLLKGSEVQLMFLDINMPGTNGIAFIKSLENPPGIVLTTAYREYAVEGFDLEVIDYLVKPIAFPRFKKTVEKASSLLLQLQQKKATEKGTSPDADNFIFVKADKRNVKVYFSDILYIESLKDYIKINTIEECLIVHFNLTGFTNLLPKDSFLRIHRSYTISLDKIKSLEGNTIHLNEKTLPIGRIYQKEVKNIILQGSANHH